MTKYTALLLTERKRSESLLIQRLSEECDIYYASTPEEFLRTLKTTDFLFSTFIMDSAEFNDEVIQLIKEVRRIDITTFTPIFLVVNDITDAILEEGYEAGVTDILVRPYTPYVHKRVMTTLYLNETSRELEQSLHLLLEAREETARFIERMPTGLFRYRADKGPGEDVIDYMSSGLVHMMGCETEEELRALCGNTFHGFVHPDDIDRVERDIAEQISRSDLDRVTYRVIKKDGEIRWMEDCGRLVADSHGRKWFYVVIIDVTEKMLESQQLQAKAEHDSLTGIYNRTAAIEKIEELRTQNDLPCSLMVIDVDDFKHLNDTYGHPFGDEVLKHLADFLKNIVRGNDVVARLGGDEFIVFLMGLAEGDRLHHIIRRINETAFDGMLNEDGGPITPEQRADLSVSIGVSSSADSSVPLDEMYRSADKAMYNTKRSGKNGYSISE